LLGVRNEETRQKDEEIQEKALEAKPFRESYGLVLRFAIARKPRTRKPLGRGNGVRVGAR